MKKPSAAYGGWLIAAAVAAASVAFACGSEPRTALSTPPPVVTATATPDATTRPISDADAVNLTLLAAEFDPNVAVYQPAQSTGPITIPSGSDPCSVKLAATLKRLGFERGYNRDWVRPDGASVNGDLSVGSYVEIYPDSNAAYAKFDHDKAHDANPPTNCGVQIQSNSVFNVTPIVGEEAYGHRVTMPSDTGAPNTYTWVEFRRGRIVASTDVIREDSRDTATETEHYAQLMDAHILRYLSSVPK